MKKPFLIVLPIVAVLVVATFYLFSAPALQINGYKTVTKTNQAAIATSVGKAIDAENQHAYFAQDVTLAEAKNALKVSKDAASDLDIKISINEKGLASLTELPLVSSVNSGYKTILKVKSLEGKYVSTSKDYLTELKSVNAYIEQTLPLIDMSDQITSISAGLQNVESDTDYLANLDKLITTLDEAYKLANSIKPAESVKEMHQASLASLSDLTSLVKQLRAAVVAQDVDTFISLMQTFTEKQAHYSKQDKDLEVKFVQESKLAKLGDALNNLNKQIEIETAKLN